LTSRFVVISGSQNAELLGTASNVVLSLVFSDILLKNHVVFSDNQTAVDE